MERKHKLYLKLNIMSLFFVGVSFISITLAWFAYSGLITARTEINVKSWQIEFNNKGQKASNELTISLDEIYPGMDTVSEKIEIRNLGDTAATIDYDIASARILDETLTESDQDTLKDILSHNYPFHIDMSLSSNYAHENDGYSEFEIAISWPLESNNDSDDSKWGRAAYDFQLAEAEAAKEPTYTARQALKIEISLTAAQYIDQSDAVDPDYIPGTIVLYDVIQNKKCTTISDSCLKTYVIDKNNKLSDSSVKLLPDLYDTYITSTADNYTEKLTELTKTWTVTKRGLKAEDIIPIISNDVLQSIIMRPSLSNEVIGYIKTEERLNSSIKKVIDYNGNYRFSNERYPYFNSSKCYWLDTEYNESGQFALKEIDNKYSKIYKEIKGTECSIVPIIEVSKNNLS